MTREEAIDILKCDISADKQGIEYCHDEVGIEAMEMAIQALEQEPCDDVVSIEAVIEWLKAKDIIKLSSQEETARRELKALPSVEQEPNGDTISREDRLVDLADAIESDDSGYWTNKRISSALRNIKNLPSVNPQKNIVNNGTMNITL